MGHSSSTRAFVRESHETDLNTRESQPTPAAAGKLLPLQKTSLFGAERADRVYPGRATGREKTSQQRGRGEDTRSEKKGAGIGRTDIEQDLGENTARAEGEEQADQHGKPCL